MSPSNKETLIRDVENALQEVIDPEIGGSVVDIGLIYAVEWRAETVVVTMTTTTRGCPAASFLTDGVRERILAMGITPLVEVRLTYEPPWTPARMRNGQMGHLSRNSP